MKKRTLLTLVGSSAVATFLSIGSVANAQSHDDLVAASKDEGSVLIYQNMNTDVWAAVKAGFEEKYPWIEVQTLDLESNEVIERYLSEKGSGRSTGDLLVTSGPDMWMRLRDAGEIEAYESPEAAAYDDWTKPIPGVYTMMTDPIIFLYNKALLQPEMVPTGMADLVAKVQQYPDAYAGKLTTYAANLNSYGYTIQYAMSKGHGDKIWEWYEALAENTQPENGAGPMAEKVAAGQYALAFLTGSASSWVAYRAPGGDQLLGWSYIQDGTPLIPRAVAVPTGASNPNAAKLMLDYILSEEGQINFSKTHRTVVHPNVTLEDTGGIETYASVIDAVGRDNVLPVPYEEDIVSGYDAFVTRWKSVFAE